jgi:GTPase
LIGNKKDNGKGLARTNVFRHKHEIICGKTSSISHHIIGFDEKGQITNHDSFGKTNWAKIVEKSVKIINFYDMGGSEKALKTTGKALSKNYIDYVFLVIAADKGITKSTFDYLKLALSMDLPIVTILTKIDMITDEEDKATLLNNFKCILKSEKKGKNPLVVKNKDDIVTFSQSINEGILPIFLISNKTGTGLDLFINFLNLLPAITDLDDSTSVSNKDVQFDLLETINVENKFILAGIVTKGILIYDTQYLLGPDLEGNFRTAKLISIHCKRKSVKTAKKGQFCSILLDDSVTKDTVRSGMVLLNINSSPKASKCFEAEIWSINDEVQKIKYTSQPIVHISHIRQSVKIIKKDDCKDEDIVLNPYETYIVNFEFLYAPEYLNEGSHIIIYQNNIKIYGYITKK